jgi:uncharacterized protein YbbC (DUF1343 family)
LIGKKVAVLVNHTSVDQNKIHLIQLLESRFVKVQKIFSPEHGFTGNFANGEMVKDDNKRNIISLYGKKKKPSNNDLKNIDILIYDIQDIGARFYTYISTMAYAMEACAENNVQFVILDRPNMLGANRVEGPNLDLEYKSFIGMFPIPVVYGMTNGELAKMIQGEKWIKHSDKLALKIIELKNYSRNTKYIPSHFIPPSPNIPDLETALIYPAICYYEGTNLSEGRGTNEPFLTIGAPWFKTKVVMAKLSQLKKPGVEFQGTTFTPISIKGKAYKPKYENIFCKGIKFRVVDPSLFNSAEFGFKLLQIIADSHHKEFVINRKQHFERLIGSSFITKRPWDQGLIDVFLLKVKKDESMFKQLREKYLIY